MTPLHFENLYQNEWAELENQVRLILAGKNHHGDGFSPIRGERVAALYRRACEHLALARARSYPRYLLDRLDKLTGDAHQVIYQRREFGLSRLKRAILVEFPRAVRAHASYVWLSTAAFALPMLIMGLLVYLRPDLILSVVDPATAADFEQMYSDSAESIGSVRGADQDWFMFGFYIKHNTSIGFQCFAGGLFAGLGTLFFLLYNGISIGAVAGYLTERGFSETFYSFVVTHGAFELTAIVLSGAAGLRLGHSLLAPGRNSRLQSLVQAARETSVIVYGFAVMFFIAAAIEAFWSSARWLPHTVKYGVAAACWIAVISYLTLQGRRAD
jgi:uncharacterized membrane protein SpoIIM required for sporulation